MAVNAPLAKGNWVTEEITPGWRQQIFIDELQVEERDELGNLAVFKNKTLGDVMVIEDRIQLTSKDESAYHEMFAHVPILGHGNVKNVLIIGGGDGATLREVLKHPVKCTLVDIDPRVVAFSKKYLPTLHQGAWEHENATIIIGDGLEFAKKTSDKYDVIIIDSTDPVEDGPSAPLYKQPFYADCKSCLTEGGIIVTQNGHPQFEHYPRVALSALSKVFKTTTMYQFCVPTYMGGLQGFGWATDGDHMNTSVEELQKRYVASGITGLQHYSPAYGKASFILPVWMQGVVDEANKLAELAEESK